MLEREHDNLRSALDWLAEHDDVDTALRLARVLSRLWAARGYVEEGRARLERLLAMPQASEAGLCGHPAAGLRGILHVA